MMVVTDIVGEVEAEPWEEAMVATEWMDHLEEQEDKVPALLWEHLAVKSFLLCPQREV